MTIWRLLLLIGAVLGCASSAAAQTATMPTSACAAIRGADLSTLQDAPTGIVSAAVVKYQPWRADLGVGDIAVCQVEGFVTPTIGFKIVMPVTGWNGKYIQGGCGGACGTTKLFWCDDPVKRGYACLGSDMGHQGTTADWRWGLNNQQLQGGAVKPTWQPPELAARRRG